MVIEPGMTPLKPLQLLSEEEYMNAQDEYGEENFRAGIGAEAIKEVLMAIDLEEELANTEEDLRENIRAIDDGRSFWDHAEAAGHQPARWRECHGALEGLTGWVELHIEQALVLQEGEMHFGIVDSIVGVNWVDLTFHGRSDHAGGTAMPNRADAGLAAAETVVELERLVNQKQVPTVGTAGIGNFLPIDLFIASLNFAG